MNLRKAMLCASPVLLAACGVEGDGEEVEKQSGESPPLPLSMPNLALAAQSSDFHQDAAPPDGGPIRLDDGTLIDWIVATAGEGALYRMGEVDLNGDNYNDALVYIGGPGRCGSGGCNLYILLVGRQGIETVGRATVTKLPVGVLESTSHGLRDVVVTIGGGGLEFHGQRVLRFDGRAYPTNPTVEPAEPIETLGEVVITEGDLRPIVY